MPVRYVFSFDNGQIMVFDADGHQIPDLQGEDTVSLRERIALRSDGDTVWRERVRWREGLR